MSTVVEKRSLESASSFKEEDGVSLRLSPGEEGRIVRKLDYSLIPLMTLFYLLSFLDRSNIGNARVAGLQADLRLTDHQYQICVTVLYVTYVITELPANLLLRRIGPNILMPTVLVIWGMICALQDYTGTVTSYAGLVAVRAFLGFVEGPMFPGIVLYLSGFYTRKELSMRIALFFSAASLSGAFSGLLAAAIENMDGINGRPGWAWIFIIEGAFTVIVGLVSFFIVPSSLQSVKFLTETERDFIYNRLLRDRPTTKSDGRFSMREVIRSVMSPHVALTIINMFFGGTTLFGLANFLPSIVSRLGFSATHTQLISVGPFACAFFFALLVAYFSDRYQQRALLASICAAIAAAGFIVFLTSTSKSVAYGSLFLSVSGTFALPPVVSAWMANNSEPHYRRATSVALGFISTSLGGILSTWSYPTSEGPRYVRGTIINITFSILMIVASIINVIYLTWVTRRKQRDRAAILGPYHSEDGAPDDGGERAWAELGDKHPDFQYTI